MNTNDIEIIREALNGGKASASTAAHFFEGYGHEKNLDRIDAALAALDQLEAQQRDIAKMEEVGDAMAKALWNPDRDYDATLRSAWNAAKPATSPQQQPKRLTDEHYWIIANRMLEEHGKYGDKLRAGHWAEIAARKVVSHLQDFGYIGGLSVEESDSIQRMLDMVDELMKLKDIHRKKLIGTATKEEWAYYQLQCEAIYPGVKDAADQMRARLTAKLNGTLS